jgi:hypothetical protein
MALIGLVIAMVVNIPRQRPADFITAARVW